LMHPTPLLERSTIRAGVADRCNQAVAGVQRARGDRGGGSATKSQICVPADCNETPDSEPSFVYLHGSWSEARHPHGVHDGRKQRECKSPRLKRWYASGL
jgi:hypothetical protein